jgi:hypothetical protein
LVSHSNSDQPSEDSSQKARGRAYRPSYSVTKVPLSYDAQIQLSAVLRAYAPWVRSTPKLIIEATAKLCQFWRTRAYQLALRGWIPLAGPERKSQLPNALACPPAFVMTFEKMKKKDKRTDCCHLRQICPFCWARETRRYWLKLEPLFFPRAGIKKPERVRTVDTGPPDAKSQSFIRSIKDGEKVVRSPYDLVYRVFSFVVPANAPQTMPNVYVMEDNVVKPVPGAVVIRDGLRAWLDSRIHGKPNPDIYRLFESRALLNAAGPLGGMLEAIQYRRFNDSAGYSWWDVQVHQLILAADGDKIPKALHPYATSDPRLHRVMHKPNRRTLVKWLARTLRYPAYLIDLDVPLEHVIEHLEARRGRRLVATYGRFRSKTQK